MNKDYLTVLPALIALFAIAIYAFATTIYYSGTSFYLFEPKYELIGFQNYLELLTWSRFHNSIILTGIFCIGVFIQFSLAFFIALLLNMDYKIMHMLRAIIIWPMVIPPVAVGLIWKLILDPVAGPLTYFFGQVEWFGPTNAIWTLIMIDTWEWTPLFCIIILAALQSIRKEIVEASLIDGLSFWTRLRVIILPRILPIAVLIILVRLIDAIKAFDIIYATTMGGPGNASEVLSVLNYLLVFRQGFIGRGAALSMVTFIILWILGNMITTFVSKLRRG
ncbi:MAG: sugar ABC transporter permease [Desulfurococcaceae archaeon]